MGVFENWSVPRELLDDALGRLVFAISMVEKQEKLLDQYQETIDKLKAESESNKGKLRVVETQYGLALDKIQALERQAVELKKHVPVYVYNPYSISVEWK